LVLGGRWSGVSVTGWLIQPLAGSRSALGRTAVLGVNRSGCSARAASRVAWRVASTASVRWWWTSAGAGSPMPAWWWSWLYQPANVSMCSRASARVAKRSGKVGAYLAVLNSASL